MVCVHATIHGIRSDKLIAEIFVFGMMRFHYVGSRSIKLKTSSNFVWLDFWMFKPQILLLHLNLVETESSS